MSFDDAGVEPGHIYWYRLILRSPGGGESVAGPIEVTAGGAGILHTELQAALEPPGGGPITIRYRIGGARAAVHIAIYDVRGHLVRALDAGVRPPGEYSLSWNRSDATGARVSRGLYFVQLRAGETLAARKFLLAHH
jgi:hypothetical protein